jgi:hypothetical protein
MKDVVPRGPLATLELGLGSASVVRPLGSDLLRCAGPIAEFVTGDANNTRLIYHLAQTTDIPIFKLGGLLCARKSSLLAWIERQENRG